MQTPHNERIIDKNELRGRVPYSPSQIRRLEAEGKFPRRIQLGLSRVGWKLSEVLAWIEERSAKRDVRP